MYFSCLFQLNAFLSFFMNGFQSFLLTLLLVSSSHKDSQKHAELQAHLISVISLANRKAVSGLFIHCDHSSFLFENSFS